MNSTVLIAGCGYVGTRLAEALAADKIPTLGICRTDRELPHGTQLILADLMNPGSIKLPPSITHVVFCPSSGGSGASPTSRGVYTEGLSNLLNALDRNGAKPQRLVYVSSSGVYAENDGGLVLEGSPTGPARDAAASILEGEKTARNRAGCTSVIARLSGIYGPSRHRLLDAARTGTDSGRRNPPEWLNQIHRDDAASAIRHLLFLDAPPPVCIVSDNLPARRSEVLAWLCQQLGTPIPAPNLPASPVEGKRLSNRLLTSTGFRLEYPTFREGYASIMRLQRRTGLQPGA